MAMQLNGVGVIDPGTGPSTKSYALVNPSDLSQTPNNADIVPVGTGPSNNDAADPYVALIASN